MTLRVSNLEILSFERIEDDSDTGEMLKDAIMQEAITDKVRAIEFDMESTDSAEVGSLLDEVSKAGSGFQRIADEDDEENDKKPKSRKSAGGSKEHLQRRVPLDPNLLREKNLQKQHLREARNPPRKKMMLRRRNSMMLKQA